MTSLAILEILKLMSKSLIILFKLVNLLRTILFPFIKFLLPHLSRRIKRRLEFESRNLQMAPLAWDKADIAFEVSSEGELEQVRPVLDYYLKKKLKVQLIFFSESVERNALSLASAHENLQVYRFPALSFSLLPFWGGQNLENFITAKRVILCRYDFFPELLLVSLRKNLKFILFAATIKNKDYLLDSQIPNCRLARWFYKNIFLSFSMFVTLTEADKNYFKSLNKSAKVYVGDFRIARILERINLNNLNAKLSKHNFFNSWLFFIKDYPIKERLILGSCYPEDIGILNSSYILKAIINRKLLLILAPHKLATENINLIKEKLKNIFNEQQLSIPLYELSRNLEKKEIEELFEEMKKSPGILINSIPGILCEMYVHFGTAYVGGGFNRSVHSLLEPYWSSLNIYCGPKTFASKEYDFIKQYSDKYVTLLKKPEEFAPLFEASLRKQKNEEFESEMKKRLKIGQEMNEATYFIINEILEAD